jgi:hypothetical protein
LLSPDREIARTLIARQSAVLGTIEKACADVRQLTSDNQTQTHRLDSMRR